MVASFFVFSLVFVVLNVVFDLFSKKVLRIDGVDFLFFAPWLAGIRYGIVQGVILAVVILIVHAMFHMRIAKYIVFSFPSQVIAIVMGYMFGISGFWVTLVVYYVIGSVITAVTGGLGARYFLFLLANSLTNIGAFFVYQVLF